MMPHPDATRAKLNLRWLVRMRWAVAASQAVAIVVVDQLMGLPVSALAVLSVVGLSVASNTVVMIWSARAERVPDWLSTALVAFDILLLTTLLYVSGGPSNPFSPLYLLHIALAAVLLPLRSTAMLGALSVICYGALFLAPGSLPSEHDHHAAHMRSHLEGMWVALALTAVFTVYFVNRVTRALAAREAELADEKERTSRSERLASLATLSAGAAHELATPLSSIAVASSELARTISSGDSPRAIADAQLIRTEVARCRAILQQMAAEIGDGQPDAVATEVAELVRAALEGVERERVDLAIESRAEKIVVRSEPKALARVLRGLVKNAIDASSSDERVRVTAAADEAELAIAVVDHGSGMAREVLHRATEPFFTTKEPGSGMGLGLFLAHEVAKRVGGSLALESVPGQGTKATLRIPISQARGAA